MVFLHVEHPRGFYAACTCRQLHLMMWRRRKKNKKHLHAPSHPRGAVISNTAFFINLTLNSFHTCAAHFLFGSQTKTRSLWKLRPQNLKRHVTSQFVRVWWKVMLSFLASRRCIMMPTIGFWQDLRNISTFRQAFNPCGVKAWQEMVLLHRLLDTLIEETCKLT